jgi:formylglycine-generating enzyme required for sulfatase activity
MSPQLRQKLQKFLEPYAQTGVLQNMVQTAFSGTRVLSHVNVIPNAHGYVVSLLTILENFGDIEDGKPSIVWLMESLQEQLGTNKQREIEGLLREIQAEVKEKREVGQDEPETVPIPKLREDRLISQRQSQNANGLLPVLVVILGMGTLAILFGIILPQLQSNNAPTQVADIPSTQVALATSLTATLTPVLTELEAALTRARAGVTTNADWPPFVHDFGDGVNMVLVPKGCFIMGSEDGESNERPTTYICFDKPFWVDETEVTQADFIRLGGTKDNANQFDGAKLPVENITWLEAQAFCEKRHGRLPTEAEWEYAVRGPDELIYPWGNDFIAENVIYSSNSNGQTVEVKSRPNGISWVGAFDFRGNVWEWTLSEYELYPYDKDDGREDIGKRDRYRVRRGGSFLDSPYNVRGMYRYNSISSVENYLTFGFRCFRLS